ncbi:hypothetical protein EB796_001584 [Bugula neritina]|uniref:Uncharacterized protein n=1 Tax=Bugula neritina TaxID=10212 RepID=A0A7J7KPK2_BUGNE|nr:hypothetical protein EB796_001584 [Bugula neritina]
MYNINNNMYTHVMYKVLITYSRTGMHVSWCGRGSGAGRSSIQDLEASGVYKASKQRRVSSDQQWQTPIYVDSRPVLQNGKHKLHNNSVIEITCLRFIFLINQDLIRSIKSEVQKSSSTVPP